MKNSKKSLYGRSILALFLCLVLLAPLTVYAQEEIKMPVVYSTVQPLTGSAIPTDYLPSSLVESLNTYLVNSFTVGLIDINQYNEILYGGMVSENAFFANSVFVGDSLTVGFGDYCNSPLFRSKTDTTYFLARVSCSAKAAVSSSALTKHAGIMPIYNGRVRYIEDSIAQMTDVNKVFICFGMNDLVGSSPESFVSDMQTLILRILEKRPDLHIYVISIPCVVSGVSTGGLNNKTIQTANQLLQNTCQTTGWGFINLSEYLMNKNMALRSDFSSDGYVHENSRAYAVWNKVLRNYAFMEIINS